MPSVLCYEQFAASHCLTLLSAGSGPGKSAGTREASLYADSFLRIQRDGSKSGARLIHLPIAYILFGTQHRLALHTLSRIDSHAFYQEPGSP